MTETKPDVAERILAMSKELELTVIKWRREDALHLNQLQGALTDFRRAERGFGVYDPDLDAPLSLEQAVCLPELGGELYHSVAMSIPSQRIAMKAMREAIKTDRLGLVSWNANHHVNRRLIQKWMSSCVTEAGQAAPKPRHMKKKEVARPMVVDFEERVVAKNAAALALTKMMNKGN